MEFRIDGAIFDVDGTLLDTMPTWRDAGARYMKKTFDIDSDPGLGDLLFAFTSQESAEYLIRNFGLPAGVPEVIRGINKEMELFYGEEAQPKNGAAATLELFQEAGIPMTVVTSTDLYMVESALERLDLRKYFREVLSSGTLGMTKREPEIFHMACRVMGTEPAGTWVFEDGLYAVRTANAAGFRTVGLYDRVSEAEQEDLKKEPDFYYMDLAEFMESLPGAESLRAGK